MGLGLTATNAHQFLTEITPQEGFIRYGTPPSRRWIVASTIVGIAAGIGSYVSIASFIPSPVRLSVQFLKTGVSLLVAALAFSFFLFKSWGYLQEPSRKKLLDNLFNHNRKLSLPGFYIRQLLQLKTDDRFKIALLEHMSFNQLDLTLKMIGRTDFERLLVQAKQGEGVQLWRDIMRFVSADLEGKKGYLGALKAVSKAWIFPHFMLVLRRELVQAKQFDSIRDALEKNFPFLKNVEFAPQPEWLVLPAQAACYRRVTAHLQGLPVEETLVEWLEDLQFAAKNMGDDTRIAVERGVFFLCEEWNLANLERIVEGYRAANIACPFKEILWREYQRLPNRTLEQDYQYIKKYALSQAEKDLAISIEHAYVNLENLLIAYNVLDYGCKTEYLGKTGFMKVYDIWAQYYLKGGDWSRFQWTFDQFKDKRDPKALYVMDHLKTCYKNASPMERLMMLDPLQVPDEFLALIPSRS